jgi:hypothetical protein
VRTKNGYMHGLWMLVHRTGTRILVRYESMIVVNMHLDLIEEGGLRGEAPKFAEC